MRKPIRLLLLSLPLFWTWAPAWVRRLTVWLLPTQSGWKCLSYDNRSTNARNPVQYFQYKWTVPRLGEGPLCIFTTRSAAHRYALSDCGVQGDRGTQGESGVQGGYWIAPCWYVPSRRRVLHQWCQAERVVLHMRDVAYAEAVGTCSGRRERASWTHT